MYTWELTNKEACDHRSMLSTKHVNIGACNYKSVQVNEHQGVQAGGLVLIKACRHGSIRSSKHVDKGANNHRNM